MKILNFLIQSRNLKVIHVGLPAWYAAPWALGLKNAQNFRLTNTRTIWVSSLAYIVWTQSIPPAIEAQKARNHAKKNPATRKNRVNPRYQPRGSPQVEVQDLGSVRNNTQWMYKWIFDILTFAETSEAVFLSIDSEKVHS